MLYYQPRRHLIVLIRYFRKLYFPDSPSLFRFLPNSPLQIPHSEDSAIHNPHSTFTRFPISPTFKHLLCISFFILCFLLVNLETSSAQQSAPNVDGKTETAATPPWDPLPEFPDKFDWIQLTSGEWLKGEFKVLYEDELQFDSDELDLQKIDWEDVKYVRGSGVFTVRFEGPFTIDGLLEVTRDKVIITRGENVLIFDRSQLVAIAAGEPKELNYWTAKISLGFTLQGGNTEQFQFNTTADIRRRTASTRMIIDWFGNFTETDGVQTVNNQRLNTTFDLFRTRKYFITPFFGEYFRNPLSNISDQITLGAGIGYHIIDTSKTEWDLSGGPGYRETRFESVPVGQDSRAATPVLLVGSNFDTELTKAVDFIFNYSFQVVNEESGTYTHTLVTAFETEITGWLDLDVQFRWDRIQDPQPAADGTVPRPDDYFIILGLGVDF